MVDRFTSCDGFNLSAKFHTLIHLIVNRKDLEFGATVNLVGYLLIGLVERFYKLGGKDRALFKLRIFAGEFFGYRFRA